jgi:hypothetical protein
MADTNRPGPKWQARLKWLVTAITMVGFGSAIAIYFVAGSRPDNPLGYEPLQTKKYVHDLELYGGKANVIAAEFREWFAGLWYGRNLAFTVAFLTILVVLVVRFVATSLVFQADGDTDQIHPPRPDA